MNDHRWIEKDDAIIFYIYKFGFDNIPSKSDIAKKIGVSVGSINYRLGNFKAIEGLGKVNHYSALSEKVYSKYKNYSKSRLRSIAFPETGATMKTAQIVETMAGNKLYQDRARTALP